MSDTESLINQVLEGDSPQDVIFSVTEAKKVSKPKGKKKAGDKAAHSDKRRK